MDSETQSQPTVEKRSSGLSERLLKDGARLRMANLMAGMWSNLQGAIQTHRWSERDTAAKHKALYGDDGTKEMEELEMPNLSLGDQIHPSPVIVPQSQPSILGPILATALLGTGIPLAGLAGYLLSQRPESPQQPPPAVNADDFSLGFGELDD